MIFPKLIHEDIVQVEDMTRFDMGQSFVTPEEGDITKVEISFDAGSNYIDVFQENIPEKWFLDYAFSTDGDKDVRVKISTATDSEEKDFTLNIITQVDDALFSKDSQIFDEETEMKKYIPKGRTSFNYAHRLAQRNVLRFLDGEGIRNVYGVAFTKEQLVGNVHVSEFSVYETMMLIFEDLRVRDKDIFEKKMKAYQGKYARAKKNARIKLDYNNDGEIGDNETKNVVSKFLTR